MSTPQKPRITDYGLRITHSHIALLLVAFILLGWIYASTVPLFEASDELWHYPMVKRLADGQGLPVQDPANVGPWRQEGSQPPLYYAVAALATFWIDTSDVDEVRWLNPHVDNGVITPDGNINLAIHTTAERFPWRGTALAVRLIRFLSVLMGAGTVYFTYRLALEVLPGRPDLALASAAAAGFIPMFVFISGAVNNDNLAALLSAAALWLLARLARAVHPIAPQTLLGIVLGLAALTKESTLGLFPLTAAVLAYNAWVKSGRSKLQTSNFKPQISNLKSQISILQLPTTNYQSLITLFILECLIVFVPAALIAGWWYWRNYALYGDWLGLNVFIQILGQRAAPASLAQLWSERSGFMQSYWGLFGGVNVPMPGWVYLVLNGLALAAVAGLAVHLGRKLLADRFSLAALVAATAPTLLVLGWVLVVIASLVRWATVTWSSQGRLAFSAISAIATLFVAGLAALLPRQAQPTFFGGLGLFLFGLSAAAPFAWIAPKYADPPPLTQAQIESLSQPVGADFGGEMRLLGFDLGAEAVQPGGTLTVTLYWQSQIAMDRDWSVFVHLLDENDIVVAQRDTYPGLGLLPTRRFEPGQTLADRYVVRVPEATYAPSDGRVAVGLYDFNTGERLGIANCELRIADCNDASDGLILAPVSILERLGEVPNPQSLNFGGLISLAGYKLDRRAALPGDTLSLTLYWHARQPIAENYSVFAHVRGEGETLWAQQDSWPQQGNAPTSTWAADQLIEDTYELTLKPDTPAGVYDIEVGLYDAAGQRLQLITPDGRLADNFAYLAKVRVLPP
jgi:hypothetical protein